MDPETRLTIDGEQIAAKVMDGEAILINLGNGLYYRIGGTGGWIWSLLESRHSLGEIADEVSRRFELSAAAVLPDVVRVASGLLEEQLMRVADDDAPSGSAGISESDIPPAYVPPVLEKYSDMAEMFALDPPLPGLADVPAGNLPPDRSDG